MIGKPHVFVGGTFHDIKSFRDAAYESLRSRATVETMEDFPASDLETPEFCYERLKLSSHYLLIIGQRYGWIPSGYDKSITELEYEKAMELGLKMKVYIFEPNDMDLSIEIDNPEKLQAFKDGVRREMTPRTFESLEDFRIVLEKTTRDWFQGEQISDRPDMQQNLQVTGVVSDSVIVTGNNNNVTVTYQNSGSDVLHELGEVYEKQLDRLVQQRRRGDRKGAAKELEDILQTKANKFPAKVAARYYYKAALWKIEDLPGTDEHEHLYNQALQLDPNLDSRVYLAHKLSSEERYEEALQKLRPLDGEAVVLSALHVLLKQRKGYEVEQLLLETDMKFSSSIRHSLALCFLQAGNFKRAYREIERAMEQDEKIPFYDLTAGYIQYWQGMPNDFQEHRNQVFPLILTDGFVPTQKQFPHLVEAASYFQKAHQLAQAQGATELSYMCRVARLLTLSVLPDKKQEAGEEAVLILREDQDNAIAFTYAVINGLELSEEEHIEPIRRRIRHETANLQLIETLIIYCLNIEQFDKALELLEDHKIDFHKEGMMKDWTKEMIRYFVSVGEWEEAESLLIQSQDISDEEQELLKQWMKSIAGDSNAGLELAEKSLKLYGGRLEYALLMPLLRQKGNWEQIVKRATEWLERYPEARAIEYLAEAQLSVGDFKGCLETLDDHLALFPDGRLLSGLKSIRLQALFRDGRLSEAIDEAAELWLEAPNEVVLINLAFLYQSLGNSSKAITILQEGIANGYGSPNVYQILTQLLVPYSQDEAFRYAREALIKYPDDESLHLHAISIGHATNHDREADELLGDFIKQFPDSTALRQVSLSEVLELLYQHREHSEEIQEMYRAGELPVHLWVSQQRSSLGEWFFQHWNINKESDKPSITFPLVFGGRGNEALEDYHSDSIIMEYSACLTSHALNLFPILQKSFSTILISPNLFNCIQSDLEKMRNHQPSLHLNRQKLSRELDRLNLREFELPVVPNPETEPLVERDARLRAAAKELNAYIVTDHFSTEALHEGRDIPTELPELQVKEHEVLRALITVGSISEDSIQGTEYERQHVRPDIVDCLADGASPLLVDEVFLSVLVKNEWLDAMVDHFDILIPSDVRKNLRSQLMAEERRQESVRWLEELLDYLRDLQEAGILSFLPAMTNEEEEGKLIQQLKEIIDEHPELQAAVWVDDRNLNSYSWANGGKSPMVSVFDVLHFLQSRGYLGIPEYLEKLNKLLKSHVQFVVPPAAYVIKLLRQCNVEKGNGQLRETKVLRSLRYMLASSLAKDSAMGKKCLRNIPIPEIRLYLARLHSMSSKVIHDIWHDESKDDDWCRAASNWLFDHALDLPLEVPALSDSAQGLELQMAFFQALMVYSAMTFSQKEESGESNQKRYLNWLFLRFIPNWNSIPHLYDQFLNHIVAKLQERFIVETFEENGEIPNEVLQNAYLLKVRTLLMAMPEEIQYDILGNMPTELHEELGVKVELSIPLDKSGHAIPISVWNEWMARALDRGSEVLGKEIHAEKHYEVMWHAGKGITSQSLEVIWADDQRGKVGFRFWMPLAQLEHGDEVLRDKWFELAQPYLECSEKAFDKLKLSSVDSLIQEVEVRLSLVPHYHFDRVKELLKSHYQTLPENVDLFPELPAMFQHWSKFPATLQGADEEEWLNLGRTYLAKGGVQSMLSMLSVLPIGFEGGFDSLVRKMMNRNEVNEADVLSWCWETLDHTHNPIQKQQLLRLLLQKPNELNENQLKEVLSAFTHLLKVGEQEENHDRLTSYKLYIVLLHYAYEVMSESEAYRQDPENHRILWAYLYADRMLRLVEESESLPVTSEQIMGALRKKTTWMREQILFQQRLRLPIEASHPRGASIWRTVVGGALDVVYGANSLPEPLLEDLTTFLKQLAIVPNFGQLKVEGMEEIFCSFERVQDIFASGFGQNNAERIVRLLEKWGIDTSQIPYDAESMAEATFKKLAQENQMATHDLKYLLVLSRLPLAQRVIPSAYIFLEKHRLTPELKGDDLYNKGGILANLTQSLPEAEKKYFTNLYRDDLIQLLLECPDEWWRVIEILGIFAGSDHLNATCEAFLNLIEEVLQRVPHLWKRSETKSLINGLLEKMPLAFRGRIQNLRRELP